MTSEPKATIVLSFEQLSATQLGPYGNAWFDTPAFNRLAGQSLVLDRLICDSTDYQQVFKSLMTGFHAGCTTVSAKNSIVDLWAEQNEGTSVFVSDDPQLCESDWVRGFDRVVLLDIPTASCLATGLAETQMAFFFAQVVELVSSIEQGDLVWVHSRGLSGPWDAPYKYRVRLGSPDDPDPPTDVAPPRFVFNNETDSPDLLLGVQQSCAAQVTLIDELLGVFLDQVDHHPVASNSILVCTALSGYPIGEHGLVGTVGQLHAESVHVPGFVRLPNRINAAIRAANLVQPVDINTILRKWLSGSNAEEFGKCALPDKPLEAAISISKQSQSFETHAWKLIKNPQGSKLYAKPDDRWEVNDIQDRCTEIAADLTLCLDEQLAELKNGNQTSVDVNLPIELAGQ